MSGRRREDEHPDTRTPLLSVGSRTSDMRQGFGRLANELVVLWIESWRYRKCRVLSFQQPTAAQQLALLAHVYVVMHAT